MNNYSPRQLAHILFIASISVTVSIKSLAASEVSPMETLTVTASRTELPLANLAGSLSVISQQDLLQVSPVHVSELLARAPGVWVSRGNGQEHLTAIRSPVLTGAGSCGAFYIAEDGVPVRPVGFCNVNELFDINTEQAQRVEIIRGPGTVIHGSDALHGVINVISAAPAKDPESLVSVEAGANNYGRIKLSHSDSSGNHAFRINANGASDGGYKDKSGFDQQKLNVRYDYHGNQWSSFTLLSASNLNQETAGYLVGTNAYKDHRRKRENPNPEAYRDSQSLRWQTRFEKSLANEGRFIVTPYMRHSDMEFLMHFLPGTPIEENGQNSAGIQTAYRRRVGHHLTLTQGVDAEITDAYLKQTQASGFAVFPAGKQYDYEVNTDMLAAFLTSEYQWTDQLSLSFGGRYETLRYDYDNRMLSGDTTENGVPCPGGCRYSRPDDRVDDFENLLTDLGLIYSPADSLIISARISHGFRAPQATELYRLQQGQLRADLDSEALNSIELGIKGNWADISYQLVGFAMKKNNVIFQSSDRLNLDNGQTRHTGLEYQLSWQITDQWDIGVSGTFAHHRYSANVSEPGSGTVLMTDGNDIDTAPRRLSTARLGWQPGPRTRLELEWVSVGRYYTDIYNEHSYAGHDLFHLRLHQQLSDGFSVNLRINNLANTDYAERADYSSFGGDRYFVGESRSVFGDIQLRF